ncbi:hypothetical protein [Synechococcus sp. KORDI-49]|uniref:hypothetical protein n=1 Tax=Synechococcus sp. KORDI-49 TaxID=585423 RepID=UPI000AABB95D|nr:hypothetical protein [Synechococcus sp. KORDI-49]
MNATSLVAVSTAGETCSMGTDRDRRRLDFCPALGLASFAILTPDVEFILDLSRRFHIVQEVAQCQLSAKRRNR